jgi:hypothetical protein
LFFDVVLVNNARFIYLYFDIFLEIAA